LLFDGPVRSEKGGGPRTTRGLPQECCGMAPPDTVQVEPSGSGDVTQQLRDRLVGSDGRFLAEWIDSLPSGEIVRAFFHLSAEEQAQLLHILDPEDAADLIDDLPDEQSADLLEEMPPDEAAAIVEELDSDDRADVLGEMEEEGAEAILEALPPEEAEEARQLLAYESDTAGGVMIKEYVAYKLGTTVGKVLDDLRQHHDEYSHYDVRYFYVTDQAGVLKGVLRLRDMVLSSRQRPIDEVMITDPTMVHVGLDLSTLQQMFETHSYSGLPVVDKSGRLLGVVIEKEVAEAARKNANRTMLKLAGIFGGEELRSMPLLQRVGRRLSWLLIILILSVCAASVIHFFEGTLEKMIALTMFLPVVAGMSGCSGNQAVALSLRELALGTVKPWDVIHVLAKEMKVGLFNGIVLGVVLGVIGYVWKGRYDLGIIIGSALALNTVISVCLGGALPLLLKGLRIDPAIASSPILTTVADTGGFLMVLSFAALMMG